MGNETNAPDPQSETQNGTDPTPETGTQGTGETPGTTSQHTSIDDALREIDELKSALKKARSDSTKHWSKAKELDELKAKLENEKLSENEKKDKQLADLQKTHDEAIRQHQEYKVNTEVRLQAAQMGFADIADAVRLLDWTEITYGDDGAPNNVKELLSKLLKAKPYLAGKPAPTAPTAGGATAPAQSQRNSTQVTQEYINRLTPQEYDALSPERKQEIRQWQAAHMFRFGQRR